MTNVRVDTEEYRSSHGRPPKSEQEGQWIFESLLTGEWFEITGPYGAAVKELDRSQYWKVMP